MFSWTFLSYVKFHSNDRTIKCLTFDHSKLLLRLPINKYCTIHLCKSLVYFPFIKCAKILISNHTKIKYPLNFENYNSSSNISPNLLESIQKYLKRERIKKKKRKKDEHDRKRARERSLSKWVTWKGQSISSNEASARTRRHRTPEQHVYRKSSRASSIRSALPLLV